MSSSQQHQAPSFISVGELSALLVPQRDPDLVLVTSLRDPAASDFLIEGTLSASQEVLVMGRLATSPVGRVTARVVVYGNSEEDATEVVDKYHRVRAAGFEHVRVFLGGLFRWLSMRLFFDATHFPCTYSARAIQELGLPPGGQQARHGEPQQQQQQQQQQQDAFTRILGVRLMQHAA